jgi:Na+-transporting methylmalonyl-CoA/oxaloacetate decarboxylase gamma subunit
MTSIISFLLAIFGAAVAVGLVMIVLFILCYAYDKVLGWFE